MPQTWDYLIVGCGAAGSVLANRLSANPQTTVLVIEAGGDVRPGREPRDILNVFPLSSYNDAYAWPDLKVHWRGADNSRAEPFRQGRIIGGSTAIMGMWAMRGVPTDFDEWERAGAGNWDWNGVLPYFRKLETDCDFSGQFHGDDGPIPIRRQQRRDWSPFAKAVEGAAARLGFAQIDDMNADFRDGHCLLPISRFETSRASAGICYLDAAVRARRNLRLMTDATASRLIVEDRKVTGVRAVTSDGRESAFQANETIITAGALQTPLLLMRSGIGPGAHLREVGISVLADRPGVGANLQTHPIVTTVAFLRAASREAPGWRPPASTIIRWSSVEPGCGPGDMTLFVRSYVTWHALGRRMAMLAPVLGRPLSRGRVRLGRAHPGTDQEIEFNLLSDPRDVSRMMAGMRLAARLYATPELRAVCGGDAWVLSQSAPLMRLNRLSRKNAILGRLAAAACDIDARLVRSLIGRFAPLKSLASLVEDDRMLVDHIHENIGGTYHVSGTARMGRQDDRLAVVDADGRVIGVERLRVADASVMPNVSSTNTHIPTVMIAEKLAVAIASQHRAAGSAAAGRMPQVSPAS